MDLLPTFAHLAGGDVSEIAASGKGPIDGHDIGPLLLGQKDAKSPYVSFCYYDQDQLQAIRSGPWKLFLPLTAFAKHPHFRQGEGDRPLLFNLVEDVRSTTDVAKQHPEIVARLTKFATAWRKELGDRGQRGDGQRSVGFLGEGRSPAPLVRNDAGQE